MEGGASDVDWPERNRTKTKKKKTFADMRRTCTVVGVGVPQRQNPSPLNTERTSRVLQWTEEGSRQREAGSQQLARQTPGACTRKEGPQVDVDA